eukprot:COSAG04_NODE_25314_length_309_cov_0.738095_2_plen_86_part_01
MPSVDQQNNSLTQQPFRLLQQVLLLGLLVLFVCAVIQVATDLFEGGAADARSTISSTSDNLAFAVVFWMDIVGIVEHTGEGDAGYV